MPYAAYWILDYHDCSLPFRRFGKGLVGDDIGRGLVELAMPSRYAGTEFTRSLHDKIIYRGHIMQGIQE